MHWQISMPYNSIFPDIIARTRAICFIISQRHYPDKGKMWIATGETRGNRQSGCISTLKGLTMKISKYFKRYPKKLHSPPSNLTQTKNCLSPTGFFNKQQLPSTSNYEAFSPTFPPLLHKYHFRPANPFQKKQRPAKRHLFRDHWFLQKTRQGF